MSKPDDKALLLVTGGIVLSLVLLIVGEIIMSHSDNTDINTEILTIVKMTITGLLGIVAGRMGSSKNSDD